MLAFISFCLPRSPNVGARGARKAEQLSWGNPRFDVFVADMASCLQREASAAISWNRSTGSKCSLNYAFLSRTDDANADLLDHVRIG
jgi:hypothetical protein